jgi:uncharacterized membrane protein YphA (DoxX/SURF4 family)
MSALQRFPSRDLGLLILRGAGFLLAATFGLQKFSWYWTAFHVGKSLSAIGLAPLIARMGFPTPVVLALWITFNESIGALLIGCGFLTRILAASAALGMAGALYTLGPAYFVSGLLYFTGLVTAAITRNERYHEFYAVFFLAQTIVISLLFFQTLV